MSGEPRGICPTDHAHGDTGTCYVTHRCGCEDCATWSREHAYWRRHMLAAGRDLLIPALGSTRRIQALVAIGWTMAEIARRLGTARSDIRRLATEADRVTPRRAQQISDLYDHLSNRTPTGTTRAELATYGRARALARRSGWARPIDWDDIDTDEAPAQPHPDRQLVDIVAVTLATEGARIHLTTTERHMAIAQLDSRGYSATQIAALLTINPKTVERHRAAALAVPVDEEAVAA